MMSLWDALRMNMMISYQELVRTFPRRAAGIGWRFVYFRMAINVGLSWQ
ncbi:ydjO [Escherichia coli]|nr:ydjO [Escherichia coli]